MGTSKKIKKFDKTGMISFVVNFCAIFSLIFTIGLLLLVDSFGGARAGLASVSQSAQNMLAASTVAESCMPAIPVMLFPASSSEPVETVAEIAVDDAGFSPKELNMAFSSSRVVKITNKGVNPHSFVVGSLGIDSGEIVPGRSATVVLENLSQDIPSFEFYSDLAGDKKEKFTGAIIVR